MVKQDGNEICERMDVRFTSLFFNVTVLDFLRVSCLVKDIGARRTQCCCCGTFKSSTIMTTMRNTAALLHVVGVGRDLGKCRTPTMHNTAMFLRVVSVGRDLGMRCTTAMRNIAALLFVVGVGRFTFVVG